MDLFNFIIDKPNIIKNINNNDIFNNCSYELELIDNQINLIYGYETAKKLLNKKIDVSSYKVTDLIYWLPTLEENSKYFIDGLNYFIENIFLILTEKISIKQIDPIFNKDFLSLIKDISKEESISYSKNKIDYYIYYQNSIYIFDLKYFYYFNNKELVNDIHSQLYNEYHDATLTIYQKYQNLFPKETNIIKYIPFFIKKHYLK